MAIDFSDKCNILAELWMNYRQDEDFEDFISYNDMGLPLAYFIHTELVTPSEEAGKYIEETYNLFIAALGIEEDNNLTTLNELFRFVSQNKKGEQK